MKVDNNYLSELLKYAGFKSDYFIKKDEIKGNTVSICRINEDGTISPQMEFISRKEMRAYLLGWMHCKGIS